jgi:hypothetical protein
VRQTVLTRAPKRGQDVYLSRASKSCEWPLASIETSMPMGNCLPMLTAGSQLRCDLWFGRKWSFYPCMWWTRITRPARVPVWGWQLLWVTVGVDRNIHADGKLSSHSNGGFAITLRPLVRPEMVILTVHVVDKKLARPTRRWLVDAARCNSAGEIGNGRLVSRCLSNK